jgi:integrative and conjugative element protein (TIGR02256 family)
MDAQFHQLFNVEEIDDASRLAIPRALSLYEACRRNRDFDVVQLLRHTDKGLECLVVDVQCDGVPHNNPYGIDYPERLAFCVPNNSRGLVEVLALRKEFPLSMHLNNVAPNSPASLCLYFEPPASVRRTWTPENFLRRIQWWLEKSAKGELHPADQPVEQLFFVTKYELVLPWNFEELKNNPEQKFVVIRGITRPDDGDTFFLRPVNQVDLQGSIKPVEIMLPTIIQGQVELEPLTLGDLVDLLERRGGNLLSVLQSTLQERVGTGVPVDTDESLSVILLQAPICRAAGEAPEKTATRAFLMMTGLLGLGQNLGMLITHEGRYYQDALRQPEVGPAADWRKAPIFPLEILRQLNAATARLQSGVEEEGPEGVIIGVGSLGSMMLDLWGRSGWGKWTAIDKDHIKPHNLARHVAYTQHIGRPKTEVVAQLHTAVADGASKVVPIWRDATDLGEDVVSALGAARLVVDASTTLEYPRLASTRDDFGRHMSVFATPDGNAAVLLAEDRDRTARLRTLEAQYYRAINQEAWGAYHLDGNLGTFWSGASCRDISTVLPYSRIVVHAATLAEQVRLISNQQKADIRVWCRDPESGAIQAYPVPVFQELRFDFGDLDLFIDEGVVQKLHAERANKSPEETGGILLGFYDFNINAVVVVDALPAPADSKSTVASFERGVEGLRAYVAEVARRTAGVVQYIGEWHSHPPGHTADPSTDDLYQLIFLSLRMAEDGLPAVSLIVGESSIQVMKGRA